MNKIVNKYSIILPVRNGGAYVKDCVNSILNQTYRDFDFIVLDNASSDGTLEWLMSLNNKRIKVYRSEAPLSIEDNWKRIVTTEKNEFITLIGHDDILFENYLETMDRLIKKHPDASLYQTHFRFIDAKGNMIRKCRPMEEVQTAPDLARSIFEGKIDIMGTGFMMRARDYDAVNGIPTAYPNLLFADFELFMALTQKSYKATSFEECFAYRKHVSTTAISSDMKLQQALVMFIGYLIKLKDGDILMAGIVDNYSRGFIQNYCKSLAHRMLRTPSKRRNGQTVLSLMQLLKKEYDKLVPGNNFYPLKQFNIQLAIWIDSNALTRGLFVFFKKIYPKPVMG